ncbi:MAG: hypothetical protein GWP08_13925 [Nitrospiraceae bacterium]|nr:hypothetical protein [Nitrospiraceae bacterium]
MTATVEIHSITHVPGVSPATAALIDALKTGTPGNVLTDEQLRDIARRDTAPGGKGYASLQSAIRHCERNHGVVWKRRPGAACIECLSDPQKLDLADRHRRHVHKTANRAVRQLATVDTNGLPEADRSKFNVHFAQLSTLAAFSSTGTRKKLEVRKASREADMSKMLEAFRENGR